MLKQRTIGREELETSRQEWRSHDGDVTPARHVEPRQLGQTERKILKALEINARPMTRGEIAKSIGLKSTPYLIGLIEGLVQRQVLSRSHGTWKNGCLMYLYEVIQ